MLADDALVLVRGRLLALLGSDAPPNAAEQLAGWLLGSEAETVAALWQHYRGEEEAEDELETGEAAAVDAAIAERVALALVVSAPCGAAGLQRRSAGVPVGGSRLHGTPLTIRAPMPCVRRRCSSLATTATMVATRKSAFCSASSATPRPAECVRRQLGLARAGGGVGGGTT